MPFFRKCSHYTKRPTPLIIEGIVTTTNADNSVNISPMGPEVDDRMEAFRLRPYKTSTTFANLRRTGEGVFHVVDDVELLAHAAVGQPDPLPTMFDCEAVSVKILADACRWYAFRVTSLDESAERTNIEAEVVAGGRLRDFFGLNRARHAVVEAAILATRTAFLPADEILVDLDRLEVLVEKTGGGQERDAFELLTRFIHAEQSANDTITME